MKGKAKWLAPGLLFFIFGLFYLYLGQHAVSPLIYQDEAGYIGWARILAGKAGNGWNYLPGYSLLLTPIFWLLDDIREAYPWIIRCNALIGALIPVLLYFLSGVWYSEKAVTERFFAAAGAALYPTVTAYSQLALCENWLCVLLLGMALCISSLAKNRKQIGVWALLLLLSVWATLTHARGLMLCFGVLIAGAVIWRDRKRALLIGGILGILIVIGGGMILLSDQSNIGSVHMVNQFRHLFTPKGIFAFVTTAISHFCCLVWSTYGFVTVALWLGISALRKREKGWELWSFLLASFFFLCALSAFYMSHHERPIHILYGRYLDVLMPALLLDCFCCLKKKKIPDYLWLISAGSVIVTGILYSKGTDGLDGAIMNSAGIFLYRTVLRQFSFWWAALFFALLSGGIWLVAKWRRGIGIGLMCLLFLVQAFYMKDCYFEVDGGGKTQIPQLIRHLPAKAEVLVADAERPFTWPYYNLTVYRPDITLSAVDQGQRFLLSRELLPGERMIGMEKNTPAYLYTRAQEGEALDYPNFPSEIQVEYSWKQTESGVEVRVKNQGSPWLCFDSVKDLRSAVRLGVLQYDSQGSLLSDDRYDFSNNLYRGEEEVFSVSLRNDCESVEIQPLVEFTAWFSDRGGASLLLRQDGNVLAEVIGKGTEQNHSFTRIPFSHLKYVWIAKNTSCAGNLINFYDCYTGRDSTLDHLKLPGGTGEFYIETGEPEHSHVFVILNGVQKVPAKRFENGTYYFPFAGLETITSVQILTDIENPFEQSGLPEWMSFLSLDSNLKPVQFMVHRVSSLMGRDVNNHEFGLRIQAIGVNLEQGEVQ